MRNTFLAALMAALAACSSAVNHVALRTAADLLDQGRPASLEEPDFQLAKDAMPAQLKLLETLIAADPKDRPLRRLAAEAFGGGAFLFLEDAEPSRAKGLYLRGRDQALTALALKPTFVGLSGKSPESFANTLQSAVKDDVPDLFWAGFGWAGFINLSKDDAAALADLPKVVALMTRVRELDPAFHFAGSDLFFGVYYASRPVLFGGDPKKAKEAFDRAHKMTRGDYQMTHVLNARWYAVAIQDRDLFVKLLKKVLESSSGKLPEARLTDEAAKRKAATLLEKTDDYF